MARNTKERIVETAIELFNVSGVTAVTTNHIAERLGISPGNLYYHFANKEEIIRDAFERMNAEADAMWAAPTDGRFDPLLLQRVIAGNLELYARYAFFARELPALLLADRDLRERYASIGERRMKQLEAMIASLVEVKLFRDVGDAEDIRALAESAWMIGLFCVPYGETVADARTARARSERTTASLERGALLVLHLFRPYMDELAYTAMVVFVRAEIEKALTRATRS
ncbi:MAG TPA: TetR/AcrR family transcriptional regulator [Labilithrix sp.]